MTCDSCTCILKEDEWTRIDGRNLCEECYEDYETDNLQKMITR